MRTRSIAVVAVGACAVLAACSGSRASPPAPLAGRADSAPLMQAALSVPIPGGIPANAVVVAMVRSPVSVAELLHLGMGPGWAEHGRAMRVELQALLDARLGIDPMQGRALSAFAAELPDGEPMAAAIVSGVTGSPRFPALGEHAGVTLYQPPEQPLVFAVRDAHMVFGTDAGVRAALDVLSGVAPGLAPDSVLGRAFAEASAGAWLAAAADSSVVSDSEIDAMVAETGASSGSCSFTPTGLRLRARGDEARLRAVAGELERQLGELVAQLERLRARQVADGPLLEALSALIAYHQLAHVREVVRPAIANGAAALDVTLALEQPAISIALLGAAVGFGLAQLEELASELSWQVEPPKPSGP